MTGPGREGLKLAYLELYGQNARLTDACAATYQDSGSTDGHEGARRNPYPESFKAVLRLVKTAKTMRPAREPAS